MRQLGSLDIAINNAGVNRNHAAEDCSEEDFDITFGLNTRAVFLCCQAEGRHMLKQGAPPPSAVPSFRPCQLLLLLHGTATMLLTACLLL